MRPSTNPEYYNKRLNEEIHWLLDFPLFSYGKYACSQCGFKGLPCIVDVCTLKAKCVVCIAKDKLESEGL